MAYWADSCLTGHRQCGSVLIPMWRRGKGGGDEMIWRCWCGVWYVVWCRVIETVRLIVLVPLSSFRFSCSCWEIGPKTIWSTISKKFVHGFGQNLGDELS